MSEWGTHLHIHSYTHLLVYLVFSFCIVNFEVAVPLISVSPIPRYTDTPLHRYSVSPIPRYTDTPSLRYSVSPIPRYTDTPSLRYSVSPIPRYTDTPIHSSLISHHSSLFYRVKLMISFAIP